MDMKLPNYHIMIWQNASVRVHFLVAIQVLLLRKHRDVFYEHFASNIPSQLFKVE